EAAVYAIPDPDIGDRVMAALVLPEGADFDPTTFREFLAVQADLGPKQWPRFVRVGTSLPRTETFKIIKRRLSAEALECDDPVFEIP
ncbi:MAG TPA: acyl-CoA synthetase, partial [Mycobacterium sp.]